MATAIDTSVLIAAGEGGGFFAFIAQFLFTEANKRNEARIKNSVPSARPLGNYENPPSESNDKTPSSQEANQFLNREILEILEKELLFSHIWRWSRLESFA
ncbi:MAG: hypothetical protein ABSH48_19775 [Verrucomicrobiota bacterium]|jgi:hypothetical protein